MKLFTEDGKATLFQNMDAVYVQRDNHLLFIGCIICTRFTDDDGKEAYAPAVIVAFTAIDVVYVRFLHRDDETNHHALTPKYTVNMDTIVGRVDIMTVKSIQQRMPEYRQRLHVQEAVFQAEFFMDGHMGVLASLDFHTVSNTKMMNTVTGKYLYQMFLSGGLVSFGQRDRKDIVTFILSNTVTKMSRLPQTVHAVCDACGCKRSLTWSMRVGPIRGRIGNECMRKMTILMKMVDVFHRFRVGTYSKTTFRTMINNVLTILDEMHS